VEAAVSAVLDAGVVTGDVARTGQRPHTTSQVGDAVASRI
jgi:3-isopropylmalate dehydrogenase